MTTRNTDYDAAQALLDLQGTVKPENPGAYTWCASNTKEDMEKTAKLFWNCFISSEIPMVSVSTSNRSESITKSQEKANMFPKTSKPFENLSSNKHRSRLVSEFNISKHCRNFNTNNNSTREDSPSISKSLQKPLFDTPKNNCTTKTLTKTKEMATQTEECYFNPNIEFMENTIKNLFERIQSLEAQLKQSKPEQNSASVSENEDNLSYENKQSTDCKMILDEINISGTKAAENLDNIQFENSNELIQNKSYGFSNNVKTNHNSYSKTNDLVPLGDGHAAVPARLLKHINWNSYTSATRKLLTAVFSRRMLATHSLTGKPSPAFPNKPAKKRLDPALVNDIVQTVVERCSVPENVVRTSITTKCADESKMFKTRQSNKRRRTSKKNCENIPPTTSESESGEY